MKINKTMNKKTKQDKDHKHNDNITMVYELDAGIKSYS